MVGIIILNWNAYQETIDCLKSLKENNYEEYFVVLADNGSSNDSVNILRREIPAFSSSFDFQKEGDEKTFHIDNRKVILYSLSQNYGFAKGNNKAVLYAKRYNPDYYLLLNNDTEIEIDALQKLVKFKEEYGNFKVLTPLIHYFFDKSLIWNAGGRLFWGLRKYNYKGQKVGEIKEETYIPITFVTGCALFLPRDVTTDIGVFCESFFHGEEDFDFSYRMKENKIGIACVLDAHIYHKVGVSTKGRSSLGKTYIYHLNRFINMKNHLTPLSYRTWRFVYSTYVYMHLRKDGFSSADARLMLNKICSNSLRLKEVTQADFYRALKAENVNSL